jgi:PEP-CTERM motif
MTFRIIAPSAAALLIALSTSAQANPTATSSVFATGPSGTSGVDSVTIGDGSVWIEYGNGVDSTGVVPGNSTIVQYSTSGAVQHTYSISGEVDGLKVDPATGTVWALQNQDANATISLINPTTHVVTGPLKYAAPPYAYGANSGPPPLNNGRGYDDVAFLNGKVYLSYTNPVNPTDPVLQSLNNSNNPTGTLTTTSILTAQQTGVTSTTDEPDIDSLKSTPNGELVLTTEGDGPGCCDPVGEFTLIAHPGAANQTVTNVPVTNGGSNVQGIDDVIFPGATSGWLYVAEAGANQVDKVWLTGLDPNTPIIAIGGLNEVALVNPSTGIVETTLLNVASPHGMDFLAAPEPSTWAMMLLGFAGLGFAGYRRAKAAVAA